MYQKDLRGKDRKEEMLGYLGIRALEPVEGCECCFSGFLCFPGSVLSALQKSSHYSP